MARHDEGHMLLLLLKKKGPMSIREMKRHFLKFASYLSVVDNQSRRTCLFTLRKETFFRCF